VPLLSGKLLYRHTFTIKIRVGRDFVSGGCVRYFSVHILYISANDNVWQWRVFSVLQCPHFVYISKRQCLAVEGVFGTSVSTFCIYQQTTMSGSRGCVRYSSVHICSKI
jgi:hypothetical protein